MQAPVIDHEALAREVVKNLAPILGAASEMEALRHKVTLTGSEVERLYGLNAGTLKQWRHQGRGPAYIKDGKIILYPQKSLQNFLDSRGVKTVDQR